MNYTLTAHGIHWDRIEEHYASAREKHPYFCDKMQYPDNPFVTVAFLLNDCRERISYTSRRGICIWTDLLECEMYEALEAIKNGKKAQAVEELYDCVAVCLRAIDVIEGRQKLGKPEGDNNEKA